MSLRTDRVGRAVFVFWFASERAIQIELNKVKVCWFESLWRSSWDWVGFQHSNWRFESHYSEEPRSTFTSQTHRSEQFLYSRCVQGWTSPTSCSGTRTNPPFLTAASRGISRFMTWVLRWSHYLTRRFTESHLKKKKMINLSAECDLFSQQGSRVAELNLWSSCAHLQFHCALLHDGDKWALC